MHIGFHHHDFIRPSTNSTFHRHNPKCLNLIKMIRLELSHLRFHKFKHSFQDTLSPFALAVLLK